MPCSPSSPYYFPLLLALLWAPTTSSNTTSSPASSSPASSPGSKAQKPNILWIVADDLGSSDVGWRGSEFPTPHIDELAYGGIRLMNYYVQLVCSPSRTSFMTGRYPLHTGFNHIVIWQDVDAAIDHDHPTIAEVLRDEHGYDKSYLIGKWHNGHAAWNNTPPGRGFEGGWYGWNGGSSDYYTHEIAAQAPGKTSSVRGFSMFDGTGPRAGVPDPAAKGPAAGSLPEPAWAARGNYSTELWADVAMDLMRAHFAEDAAVATTAPVTPSPSAARRSQPSNNTSKPFFMYLGFQSPHAPVQASPDAGINARCAQLTRGQGRDTYCSMVTYMDRKIGEITATLKDLGQYDNTLIILSSDNGGCMPGENRGCNWPHRGGKHHLFEGGVQVTGFVSGGVVPPAARGATSHALAHAVDWFPTILGAIEDFERLERPTTTTTTTTDDKTEEEEEEEEEAKEGVKEGKGGGDKYGTTTVGQPQTVLDRLASTIDGVNLWPALTSVANLNTSTIDPAVTYSPRFEIPHNVDPLLHAAGMPSEPQGAVRLGTYKLVVGDLDIGWLHCNMTLERPSPKQGTAGALNGTFALFDLLGDPYERTDLSQSIDPRHQAALARLLERWAYWKGETVAPNYPDSDPRSYPRNFKGGYNGSWAPWLDPDRPY